LQILAFILAFADCIAAEKKEVITSDDIAGHYAGVLKFQTQILNFELKIENRNGKYTAFFRSPDQTPQRFPAENLEIKNKRISFSNEALGLSFKGTAKDNFSEISGTFKQGTSVPLKLQRVEEEKEIPDYENKYSGVLKFSKQTLRFELFLAEEGDDFLAYAISPDQNSEKIVIKDFKISKTNQVTFSIPFLKIKFQGKVDDARKEIKGTFTQFAEKVPLTLLKEE